MNLYSSSICCFLFIHNVFSNQADLSALSSKIEEVTVYQNGAQIRRISAKGLEEGVHTLKFSDLSPYIDGNSVQVQGIGDFTILSVTHQTNYLKGQEKSKEVLSIEDSLLLTNDKLEINKKLKEVYEQERSLLNENKTLKVNEKSLFVEDLEELANFFRERYSDLSLKMLEIDRIEKKLVEKRNKFQNQLNEISTNRNKSTGEIIVEVSCEKKINARFSISYIVSNASWTPSYDIRAKDIISPLDIDYKAKVRQNTGEEWANVKFNLSTGNPTRNSSKPVVLPWLLKIVPPVVYKTESESYLGRYSKDVTIRQKASETSSMTDAVNEELARNAALYTSVEQSQMNTQFKIKLPYTVPSDGKEHVVQIQKLEMKPVFESYVAPKYNSDVFLLARVINWGDYNLLSGSANIYYDGAFTGSTYLNTQQANDTLDIALGRDPGIVVERTQIKDFTEKKLIGSNKKETFGYQISLKNNRNFPVTIVIEDQIPVSGDKEIEIELIESSEFSHSSETGLLKWNVRLNPNESAKRVFRYSVKYPKDKILNL